MSGVRVKTNVRGVRDFLRSQPIQADLAARTARAARAAGEGFAREHQENKARDRGASQGDLMTSHFTNLRDAVHAACAASKRDGHPRDIATGRAGEHLRFSVSLKLCDFCPFPSCEHCASKGGDSEWNSTLPM